MSRRKGEQPIPITLDSYTDEHPVARLIATGDPWFHAWMYQKATPIARLSRTTGIPGRRLMAIEMGDRVSETELNALALAWSVSAADLRLSIADAVEIIP